MVKIKRLESFPKPVATYCVKSHLFKSVYQCPGNTNRGGELNTIDIHIKEDYLLNKAYNILKIKEAHQTC